MADNFKQLADNHLANYMKEAKEEGLDPEKSVLGLMLAIVVQLEHKHGKKAACKLVNGFAKQMCPAAIT